MISISSPAIESYIYASVKKVSIHVQVLWCQQCVTVITQKQLSVDRVVSKAQAILVELDDLQPAHDVLHRPV